MTNVANQRQMLGEIKRFDAGDHAKYDELGKVALLTYLNANLKADVRTIPNPNKYGIDLISLDKDDKVRYAWEVEVRYGNWSYDTEFPYKEINCIERKDYLWRKDNEFSKKIPYQIHPSCIVYYVQLNKLCNRAVVIRDSIILEYPLKPWVNRKADNEYVRQVPLDQCVQIKLTT